MALIISGDKSVNAFWAISPTSNAASISRYNQDGSSWMQKTTYRASTTAKKTGTASVNAMAILIGSDSKIVRVARILVTATIATTATYQELSVDYVSILDPYAATAPSTLLIPISSDSSSPISSIAAVGVYTGAAPFLAVSVDGYIASKNQFLPVTGTVTRSTGIYDFDWRGTD